MSIDSAGEHDRPGRRAARASGVLLGVAIVAGGLLTAPAAWAARTIVVDDDRVQCAGADYDTVAEAVEAARAGDTVRVCPGLYREEVTVDASIRIVGPSSDVRRLDCFGAWPAVLDTTRLAVLRPPVDDGADANAPILTLDADDVDVSGLVFEGVLDNETVTDESGSYTLVVAAVSSTDQHAGYRIRSNAFRGNALALELGNAGGDTARVTDNCFRENDFGVANQRFVLEDADIAANATYRNAVLAYELGWGYRQATGIDIRGNVSREDGNGLRLENTTDVDVAGNRFTDGGRSYALVPSGILIAAESDGSTASTGVTVRGNTVTRTRNVDGRFGLGISVQPNALDGGLFVGNTLSSNVQTGLVVQPGNDGNVIRGNVANDNGGRGIRIFAGATGNQVIGNAMHGNGFADAEDNTDADPSDGITLQNTWRGNACETDIPAGAIC